MHVYLSLRLFFKYETMKRKLVALVICLLLVLSMKWIENEWKSIANACALNWQFNASYVYSDERKAHFHTLKHIPWFCLGSGDIIMRMGKFVSIYCILDLVNWLIVISQ